MNGRGARRKDTRCRILASGFSRWQGWEAQKSIHRNRLACRSVSLTACHSYHIDTTIENRTGAAIQLLEVDYPSASFGADRSPSGAVFHYRFQIRGSGPLKITYTGAERQTGPDHRPNARRAPARPAQDRAPAQRQGRFHPATHARPS